MLPTEEWENRLPGTSSKRGSSSAFFFLNLYLLMLISFRDLCIHLEKSGLSTKCLSCDEVPFEEFVKQPTVLFVISTSGQGKFPLNAKQFWHKLNQVSDDEFSLNRTQFAVFGLGDSQFWKAPLGLFIYFILFYFIFACLFLTHFR
jgi:hypothetical protein